MKSFFEIISPFGFHSIEGRAIPWNKCFFPVESWISFPTTEYPFGAAILPPAPELELAPDDEAPLELDEPLGDPLDALLDAIAPPAPEELCAETADPPDPSDPPPPGLGDDKPASQPAAAASKD